MQHISLQMIAFAKCKIASHAVWKGNRLWEFLVSFRVGFWQPFFQFSLKCDEKLETNGFRRSYSGFLVNFLQTFSKKQQNLAKIDVGRLSLSYKMRITFKGDLSSLTKPFYEERTSILAEKPVKKCKSPSNPLLTPLNTPISPKSAISHLKLTPKLQ